MRKQELEQFLKNLDIEEFENYYRHHNNKDVCSFYAISKFDIEKILVKFNISKKTKEEINIIISENFHNKSEEEIRALVKKREDTMSNWSPEQLENLSRIRKNAWTEEAKKKQKQTFQKTQSLKSEEQLRQENLNRSVAAKSFWVSATDEQKRTFSEKMKETYAQMTPEQKQLRINKILATRKERGILNPISTEAAKQKLVETNLQRYGVPYFCMTSKCRSAMGGNSSLSGPNKAFSEQLGQNNFIYTENDFDIEGSFSTEFVINNFSYDFKVVDTLIEINPTITHNSTYSPFNAEKGIDKKYHFNKTKTAVENGYRCIHVWDWDDVNKIITLLKNKETIYARKCEIKEVSISEAKDFIEANHLQGYAKSSVNIGLYYQGVIVSIMTFDKPRYNKRCDWELIRYCSTHNILGGSEKIFKYFKNNYEPKSIVSYCDLSKFTGRTYEKLGFTLKSVSIGRHWYNIKTGVHITDNLLRQRGFDQLFGKEYGFFGKGTSNKELMLMSGFVEIYDAGQATYIWQ